jgi:hypothetical protein
MLALEGEGLASGHAYSITRVVKAKCLSGKSVSLLRVRNPWGGNKTEWTGQWSDDCKNWLNISDVSSGFLNRFSHILNNQPGN